MKMQIDQSRNGVAAFSVQNIPVKLRRILFFINLSDLIPIQDNALSGVKTYTLSMIIVKPPKIPICDHKQKSNQKHVLIAFS